MTRSVSPVRAKEMALFGDPADGRRAAEWGSANKCVPHGDLLAVAGDYARRLAALPTIGVGHIKNQINDAVDATFDQVAKQEVTLLGIGIGADADEAMAAFMERREPRFTGR
ncbi:enoyl-CoA hydratase/isomerase family protein [Streptomyces canus]|uniref:enoyl-CoA hydratase/isomerase family protein n=1 Tax=Streptomyces canus TaxID=58343 RepID=UPI00324CA861